MTKNSRLAGSAGGDDDFEFSWKIFTAWDFMIANPETADNKVASIATVVRESIVDEQESSENMTTKEKRVLLVMRVIANILVAAIIAGAIALITWRTIATTKAPAATTNVTVPKTKPSWFQQNELSLDITAITMLCKLNIIEQYDNTYITSHLSTIAFRIDCTDGKISSSNCITNSIRKTFITLYRFLCIDVIWFYVDC